MKTLRKLFLSFYFLLYFFSLYSQSAEKLWLSIDSIEKTCNASADRQLCEKYISDFNKKSLDKANPFLKKLISLRIMKITARAELYRNLQNNKIGDNTINTIYELTKLSKGTFASSEKAYESFVNSAPSKTVLQALSITRLEPELFKSKVWDVYCKDLSEFVMDKENIYYDMLTPNKSRKQLWDFIEKSVYPQNQYHSYRAIDAYNLLFLYYTNTGELTSIAAFSKYMDYKTNNVYIWNKMKSEPAFIRLKDSLTNEFDKWQTIVMDAGATDDELGGLVEQSAPREIAFVALQKLIKTSLLAEDYNLAVSRLQHYLPFFHTDETWADTEDKVLKLIDVLHTAKEHKKMDGIRNINTRRDEISYFLNAENTSIVLNPDILNMTKQYSLDKVTSTFSIEDTKFQPSTTPKFLWFEKRMDRNDAITDELYSKYHLCTSGCLSTDFFLSADGKILFFVSTDTVGRQQVNKNSNEYSSPGLIYDIEQFQEKGHGRSFHGKTSGNPNTDIYYCMKLSVGWSAPKLLHGVNTPFCERSPVYDQKKGDLYFASEGWPGLGGFDIFKVHIAPIIGTDITANGNKIENEINENSAFDDLFYNPNVTPAIISNNKNAHDFDLYWVKEAQKLKAPYVAPVKPSRPPPSSSSKPKPDSHDETMNTDNIFIFDWQCIEDPYARFDDSGKITVMGKLIYTDSTPVSNAEVLFMDIKGNYYPFRTLKDDNQYITSLPYSAEKYKVLVTVYYKNGNKIKSRTESFLSVCDNIDKTKRIRQDFIVPKEGQKTYQGSCPFFFDTKVHNSTLTDRKQARVYFARDKEQFKYECIGYADIRGDSIYNYQLALKRANYMRDFLINEVDINSDDVVATAVGATKSFSNQKIEKYKLILNFSVAGKYPTREAIELLLNRRVEVRLVKKYFTVEE